jgi:hypothetical protein
VGLHIILKFNIMKLITYKNSRKEQNEQTGLWDAFVSYLENAYFPGAAELLPSKLIAFEYESFRQCYA